MRNGKGSLALAAAMLASAAAPAAASPIYIFDANLTVMGIQGNPALEIQVGDPVHVEVVFDLATLPPDSFPDDALGYYRYSDYRAGLAMTVTTPHDVITVDTADVAVGAGRVPGVFVDLRFAPAVSFQVSNPDLPFQLALSLGVDTGVLQSQAFPTDLQASDVYATRVFVEGTPYGLDRFYADGTSVTLAVVPEPGTGLLMGLGLLGLAARRKRRA